MFWVIATNMDYILALINSFLLLSLPNISSCSFIFEDLLVSNKVEAYNKFHRPQFNESSMSDQVIVFIHLESMRDISSETTLDFYLIQEWFDPRIIPKVAPLKITGGDLPDSIWYPDTYFQLVRSQIYSTQEQYIVVDHLGNIEYNRKVRLTTPCSPDVMLFPFDVVTCSLTLSSFGYTADEVFYRWKRDYPPEGESGNGRQNLSESWGELGTGGVHIDEKNNNVDHLGFYLRGAYTTHHQVTYGGANYSTLQTVFLLQRKFSAYLMQVYLPAGLIVMLSWTIFWINVAATPARASLGVTTVLTMLTLATQSTAQNEKHVNRKLTAIDLYLWACFLFVIFAMLEFALSDYTTFRHNTVKARADKIKREIANHVISNMHKEDISSESRVDRDLRNGIGRGERLYKKQDTNGKPQLRLNVPSSSCYQISDFNSKVIGHTPRVVVTTPPRRSKSALKRHMKHLYKVNEWARWAFPLGFFTFNVIYWTILLYIAYQREYP